jgi:hypothetical protein
MLHLSSLLPCWHESPWACRHLPSCPCSCITPPRRGAKFPTKLFTSASPGLLCPLLTPITVCIPCTGCNCLLIRPRGQDRPFPLYLITWPCFWNFGVKLQSSRRHTLLFEAGEPSHTSCFSLIYTYISSHLDSTNCPLYNVKAKRDLRNFPSSDLGRGRTGQNQ